MAGEEIGRGLFIFLAWWSGRQAKRLWGFCGRCCEPKHDELVQVELGGWSWSELSIIRLGIFTNPLLLRSFTFNILGEVMRLVKVRKVLCRRAKSPWIFTESRARLLKWVFTVTRNDAHIVNVIWGRCYRIEGVEVVGGCRVCEHGVKWCKQREATSCLAESQQNMLCVSKLGRLTVV